MVRYRRAMPGARRAFALFVPRARHYIRGVINPTPMSLQTLLKSAALLAAAMAVACQRTPDTDPRLVSEWMHTYYGAIRVERLSPPVASRLLAYSSTALYAGLAVADRALPPLAGRLNAFPTLPTPGAEGPYDGTLAAVAAERVVL